jgi:Uma2 family endonuclease
MNDGSTMSAPAKMRARDEAAQAGRPWGAEEVGLLGPPDGWWILSGPEPHLGADALVPDLAGWRRERLPSIPREAFLSLAPDWVMEVLSPSTASLDRVSKARVYAREGVRWLWLVDPLAHTVEVNRLHDGVWVQVRADLAGEPVRAEPFEAVEFDTADWFDAEARAGT